MGIASLHTTNLRVTHFGRANRNEASFAHGMQFLLHESCMHLLCILSCARSQSLADGILQCAAVDMVRNGTVAAYMTQLTLLQYLVNQQPCDMAIVDSGWGYGEQVTAPVPALLCLHCIRGSWPGLISPPGRPPAPRSW